MRRREFLALIGSAVGGSPLAVHAQPEREGARPALNRSLRVRLEKRCRMYLPSRREMLVAGFVGAGVMALRSRMKSDAQAGATGILVRQAPEAQLGKVVEVSRAVRVPHGESRPRGAREPEEAEATALSVAQRHQRARDRNHQ